MSFAEIIKRYQQFDFDSFFQSVDEREIDAVLRRNRLEDEDLLRLLSPAADNRLETMALRAQTLTRQYFGRTISLYLPLYLSNYCINQCRYCGFSQSSTMRRSRLTNSEIRNEALSISRAGVKHVLLLTGDAPARAGVEYIEDAVRTISDIFASIGIEVFALTTDEYRQLISAGVDSLTIYQECYNREVYAQMHPTGPKSDYDFRLQAPERGCAAGMRSINLGVLFGLDQPGREAFFAALHARYLMRRYPGCAVSLSLPRITACAQDFATPFIVDDRQFARFLLAYRLYLPQVGITLSTRESPQMRDGLLSLGVTRISAGSRTAVGGYSSERSEEGQFSLGDERSVATMTRVIEKYGLQPVFKDWLPV